MQCCPRSINTTLNKIFLCNIVWSLKDNIVQGFSLCKIVPGVLIKHCRRFLLCNIIQILLTQESYLCNISPERTDIALLKNNQRIAVLNLPGPTLHKTITCAMLVPGPQSTQYCLNTSEIMLYATTNYLCNVGPECAVIFSQEDNLCNVVLICLGQHCTRKLHVQC